MGDQMKSILMVSAVAWMLTIALAMASSPRKSAGNEALKCLVDKGDVLHSKQTAQTPACETCVGCDADDGELELNHKLNR
jgi:hypothetical protein